MVNDAYCHEVLLIQKLPHDMHEICGVFFILQQFSVPAHRAPGTINLLKRDTCVHFTGLFAISIDLNPIDYKNMGEMQQRVYQVHDVDEQKQLLIDVWHRFKQSIIDDAVDEWRKCIYK